MLIKTVIGLDFRNTISLISDKKNRRPIEIVESLNNFDVNKIFGNKLAIFKIQPLILTQPTQIDLKFQHWYW